MEHGKHTMPKGHCNVCKMGKGSPVSAHKAGIILKEGEVRGHKLTPKQERFFGFIRGGGTPTKV